MKLPSLAMLVLAAICASASAEKLSLAQPAPADKPMKPAFDHLYCDSLVNAVLWPEAKNNTAPALTAEISDDNTKRLVLEVNEGVLYVHKRSDFEKGELFWGREWPLRIMNSGDATTIVAFGPGNGPRNSTATFVSLNRSSGAALVTTSQATIFAEDGSRARNYGASIATYLKCGDRQP